MIVPIDIPESLVREAEKRGIAVENLVRERLTGETRSLEASGLHAIWECDDDAGGGGGDIRELRKGQTLGGEVTIRQLIEEGRRY